MSDLNFDADRMGLIGVDQATWDQLPDWNRQQLVNAASVARAKIGEVTASAQPAPQPQPVRQPEPEPAPQTPRPAGIEGTLSEMGPDELTNVIANIDALVFRATNPGSTDEDRAAAQEQLQGLGADPFVAKAKAQSYLSKSYASESAEVVRGEVQSNNKALELQARLASELYAKYGDDAVNPRSDLADLANRKMAEIQAQYGIEKDDTGFVTVTAYQMAFDELAAQGKMSGRQSDPRGVQQPGVGAVSGHQPGAYSHPSMPAAPAAQNGRPQNPSRALEELGRRWQQASGSELEQLRNQRQQRTLSQWAAGSTPS